MVHHGSKPRLTRQQCLAPQKYRAAAGIVLQPQAEAGAVGLKVRRTIGEGIAQRARMAHGNVQRTKDILTVLKRRQAQSEVRTTQVSRRLVEQGRQRAQGQHGMTIGQHRRIKLNPREQLRQIPAERCHQFVRPAQRVNPHQGVARIVCRFN